MGVVSAGMASPAVVALQDVEFLIGGGSYAAAAVRSGFVDAPAAFSVSRPSPSGRISRTPRPSSSASGKTVRSSDGVTRLAASPSQGLRPQLGGRYPS
jgi:hypothetical protein